ncbi:MAG: hypothetical protein P4L28_11370 [Paludibacteraceae bacterium]|nr:hypothetical protein [Paludibacteraceae bacterium]
MRVESFSEIRGLEFPEIWYNTIKQEILSKSKDYILKVDENEYLDYLINKYNLEPLKVINESELISDPITSKEERKDMFGRYYISDVYIFTITYQFSGSAILFRVQSNPYTLTSYPLEIDNSSNRVSFTFKIYKQDPEEFKQIKSQCYSSAFANIDNLNKNIANFNSSFENTVRSMFLQEKNKYKSENDFFAAINVKTNSDTEAIFSAPVLKKKIISQPQISKGKEFNSVPSMSQEMYNDILTVIYNSGKSMEKKPALYIGKDEEGIRDQFLFILETRYEGTTATGETFNRSGKADIILKYAEDGTNLFIAECKFWHGQSEYIKAISQLFDRYLTWRDSKVAVILFVDNVDFTNVLDVIKSETLNHPYYIRTLKARGESSFSYIFHLPQDKNKEVQVEIMAFHFDKR